MITKKYQLQYIKLGLPTNINNVNIGYVLRTEIFDSPKEFNFVIKKLIKSKGFEKHGAILLSKKKQIKVNLTVNYNS